MDTPPEADASSIAATMISCSSACGSVHGNNTISDTEKDSVDIEVLFNACISSDGYFAEYLQKYEDINLHNEGTK